LPEIRFPRPQFFRQTELHIEIAVVDGPQFAGQDAAIRFGGMSREPGHAM
jgi:hypothetical protein